MTEPTEHYVSAGPLPGWYVRAPNREIVSGPHDFLTAEAVCDKLNKRGSDGQA